ncbi:hypothetical protein [Nocardia sp. IFM 10818]
MADRIAQLRAEQATLYEQMDAVLAEDPEADTTALEDRVLALDEQIGAILDVRGADEREKLHERPKPPPPPASDRLF